MVPIMITINDVSGSYPKFQKHIFVKDSEDIYFVKDTTTCPAT